MLYDLLEDPLLSWRDQGRRRMTTTLPGILARLASGQLGAFPRLRTHQFHPWCMFLTQVAAIALERGGLQDPQLDERAWRELLLTLTQGRHEPWCLVVEDLAAPAFFQAPVPEGTLTEQWKAESSPDDIDVLATAKAHDLKRSLIRRDDPEAWVYALSTLQTTQGVYGQGKYGVARMNGGYGSRCRVGFAPDVSPAGRFRRDVGVLLSSWPAQIARGYNSNGIALVWTEPWDGNATLDTSSLAPHFVEICRRVRMITVEDGLLCRGTTSGGRRCLPDVSGGDVADAWIPIERTKGAALSVKGRGFDYELLVRLLFDGDFEQPAAQRILPGDPDPLLFVAAALARGQGGTEGLHERVLTVSGELRIRLRDPDARALIGRRAGERVLSAQRMRSKVLFPALKQLGEKVDDALDARVDEVFFDHLMVSLDKEDESARLLWERLLLDLAQAELQGAISRCALPSGRRYKVISAAESMFAACLRKNFPDIVPAPTQKGASA